LCRYIAHVISNKRLNIMKTLLIVTFLSVGSFLTNNNTNTEVETVASNYKIEIKVPAKKKAKMKQRKTMIAFESSNYTINKHYI